MALVIDGVEVSGYGIWGGDSPDDYCWWCRRDMYFEGHWTLTLGKEDVYCIASSDGYHEETVCAK